MPRIPCTVRLVEAATGRVVGPALEHKNTIMCAAFSPDSRMLATSSTDATVRLWAVPGGEPLARPLDLHRSVSLVAFSPGGRSLATQDGDLVRLWALPEEGVPMAPLPLDGKRLVHRPQSRRHARDPDRDDFSTVPKAAKHEGLSRRDRPTGRATAPPRGPDRRCGLFTRRAMGHHPQRGRRCHGGDARGRGLGLGERPAGGGGRPYPRSPGAWPIAPTAAASLRSAAGESS